MTRDSA